MIRRQYALILVTILGTAICRVDIGKAQTVEPSAEPAVPSAPNTPANAVTPPAATQETAAPVEVEAPKRTIDKAALDEAKRDYSAGEAAYQAGDYKTAIKNFQDAQAIIPSAQASYWLSLSLMADGQVPEAIAEIKSLLASPTAQTRLGNEKVSRLRTSLEELIKTPGVITLSTDPPGASASVDGEVRPGVSPLAVELTPGTHTLTLTLPGYQSVELELEVPPGSKGKQHMVLTALPPPPAPVLSAPPVAATPTHNVVLHPAGVVAQKPSRLGMYVVFGLAGAGAVVGAVFGILALGEKSDFEKRPSDSIADKVERNATVSDIGFGAAITFGLAGLVMATSGEVQSTTQDRPATAQTAPRSREFAVSPYANRTGGGAKVVLQF